MIPRVIGLDLSLASTGVAGAGWTDCIKPGTRRGIERLHWIRGRILEFVIGADLVVIEGPAYSKQAQPGHHEAAGLWWLTAWTLRTHDIAYVVISPSAVKKYATGRGNATKPDMRVALKDRAKFDERDDNKVDAWWLCAMGLAHLGHPPVELPKLQREVLDNVEWSLAEPPKVPAGRPATRQPLWHPGAF